MRTKRDFLSLRDLSWAEATAVLELAKTMKRDRASHLGALSGQAVAIVMEKASTRTRVSFEVGVAQLGAHPVVLGVEGSQLGRGEPIKDTARVLARYCDAIVYRTSTHARLLEMASADVPVINALTDDGHPVQVLSDVFTIEEALDTSIAGMRIAWVGDGSSNMARSWVEAAALFGFDLAIAAPKGYRPPDADLAFAGAHVALYDDPQGAIEGSDVVNTDVWTSMGQEAETAKRLAAFRGYTLDDASMSKAKSNAIVLHCLPAHRGEEITESLFEGERSRVWDQAENRLHVQKALLLSLLRRFA